MLKIHIYIFINIKSILHYFFLKCNNYRRVFKLKINMQLILTHNYAKFFLFILFFSFKYIHLDFVVCIINILFLNINTQIKIEKNLLTYKKSHIY